MSDSILSRVMFLEHFVCKVKVSLEKQKVSAFTSLV